MNTDKNTETNPQNSAAQRVRDCLLRIVRPFFKLFGIHLVAESNLDHWQLSSNQAQLSAVSTTQEDRAYAMTGRYTAINEIIAEVRKFSL